MGFYSERKSYFNKGITFYHKDSSPVIIGCKLYVPKRGYKEEIHGPLIQKLLEEFKVRHYTYPDGIYISFEAPFRGSQVIGISYRKRLNRAIKSIVKYDNENLKFLIEYVKYYISKDYNMFYGE